jgi:adenosylcobinamide-phosphate synthase
MVNTADAMLGYRTAELEWFGKTAARIDDVANFVPARCAAALVACCAPLGLGSPHRAISAGFADGGNTASPNAGWPMAAMAGALDVRLTKRDCYVLNAGGREPTSSDIRRACRIVAGAAVLAATLVDLS